ncbi:cadherin domain-containing protein [Roseibium denhamense]|uniref:cadherin domain-containing protein n=1 Tax=Roseibium denhamense TaxID=76305 RepID=UPI0024B68E3A|nr:cadherin domain-containing protein [Roseibium denhamense]
MGTFTITIGDENEAPIGPVSDSDTTGNEVSEFATGGEYSGVTAFADDPDVTDVVSYELTGGDDRFEIDPDTGEIFVKDGSTFDAETEQSVDVEVTATSTDGSTSVGTFTITIGDENEAPIGPVSDSDTTGNEVSEFATGGEYSGVTAFADDPDVTDVVSYELTGGDDRFEIDPDTGVITVKDGSSFDFETEPTVSVEVTATSTDGSTSTGTFDIQIQDGNEPPDLVVCLEDSGNLVINGSFEQFEGTLSGTDPKGYYENPESIEGWTYQDVDVQQSDRQGAGTTDGDHRLDLSANKSGFAAQQIEGMLEGQVYTFSFDAAPRGGVGETVAEVYWNGELIDTIDPATTGKTWQNYSYEIVGGSGDGSDTLTFVEVGGGNKTFGTFIDNVSVVSDSRIAVVEEYFGAEIAPLAVFDPDVGDTHTFTVSDDRFEVVVSGDKYVLKLKDTEAFDYETETQVTVDVTVTDSGGLTDTETVVIDVLDVDENMGPVGPVTDSDTTTNVVAENGTGGEYTGVTAFADDPDVTDVVTYELTGGDGRFDIDPDTGEIFVKDGISFDHEAEPELDVEVTATSSDGSTSTGTFTINIGDVNEAPDLVFHTDEGAGTSATITFTGEEAGYSNSFGVFVMDDSSNPVAGQIVWTNGNTLTPGETATVNFPGIDAADIGYFLIPDGADLNSGIAAGDMVTFQLDGNGNWQAIAENGTPLVGQDANVYFSGDESLNPDGLDHTTESGISIGFEDLVNGGDNDFDDFVFDADTSEYGYRTSIVEEVNGAEAAPLSVFDPDAGDTHTFAVSDDRFEVVVSGDKYVLKLKDTEALDYETETQVTVEVTATDTGGLSDTETIIIDVIDVPENVGPIGPVTDSDTTTNVVAENGAGGEYTGVTAFADDPDVTDVVSYELTGGDNRFDIDPDTGEIFVKDGVSFDHEAEPALDVEVTATSSDGSTSTGVFTIDIGDVNEAPDLVVEYGDVGNNLIKNGSFESFDVASGKWSQFADDNSGAWTSDGKMEVWDNFGGVSATEGDQHLELDSEKNVNSISQTVETSVGQVYDLSFDVQARTNDASNTVEVYWNGELVASVDPEKGTWQTVEFQVVGTGGDDVLEFRETSEDNNTYGAFIDDVRLTGTDRIGIVENNFGAEAVPLSVIDPDAGDTHTFTVSDDRFEVVVSGNQYVLKLKDDQALDYETETQVTLQVTATDQGGLSDTETVVIDVIDVPENTVPVGPVTDVDGSSNAVVENSAGGTVVGVTAFADDPDVGDDVTYSITDDRFEIDPDTGVITVADNAVIDREATPFIDIDVTATSTDGSSSTGTFRVTVGDENEFSIGPVSDIDTTGNSISETADGGEATGITAFADDQDATDTVSYELTSGGDRFEIDADTGVITVKAGASFDAETEPAVDVTVKATSTDGSSASSTFTIEVQDGNEAPDLVVHLENGSQQFVVNGSFEVFDGTLGGNDGSGWYQNPDSIEGWTYQDVDVHQAGHNNFGATDGDHHLDLAAKTNGTASQAIEGMLDGQVYNLTFDMKSRGGTGQSVAEVYWNGELIDTIDPATTGTGWQEYGYDLVGGSGDGSNTLTFVEIGSDNNGGALIDSVSIVSDNRTAVVEEFFGAEIAPLSVIDPDVGDTHTFTVSDDRFEVVVSGDKYLLKLKDDKAFDYETETQVTVDVTATDQGGLSDTETIVIDVIDIDDANAPIGPLSDKDTSNNAVMENAAAGTVVGITAFAADPDAGDSVTYAIGDDRFDIDPDTGVVTVADQAVIDREATPFIDVDITATSTDGSSVTETFRISIGDENEFSIGPITDTDTSDNTVSELATGGEIVGITAFADDPDATDTVTYELSGDDRFEIDPDSGVITVKDGAVFDAETEPNIDVMVTATSTDGSQSTETFSIDVSDGNEAPDLDFDPELGPGVAITMTFVEEFAGYSNTVGVFVMDGNGNPVMGEIVWLDQNALTAGDTKSLYIEGFDAADVGYFIIPDGGDLNAGLQSGDEVSFQKDGNGNWQAVAGDGTPLVGHDANIYFSGDGSLNADGFDHTDEMGVTVGFEDLIDGGDKDFDDVVFDQTIFETDARASVYEEQPGATVGELTVADPDVGDTHTFAVSDDRFEVVETNGVYVLKLKDDQALDYETETQVTVDVTVTDSGGLSDTETIVIDVIDVEPDNDNNPVGPVSDTNTAQNLVAASAAAGTLIGLTAFADDADAGDVVTYSIDDDRFDIDADTGVVTVASGATLNVGETINVTITAASSDGTESSGVFPVEVTAGGPGNQAPDLIVGDAISQKNFIKNGSFEEFTSSGKESGSGDAIWYGDAKVDHWKTSNTDIHKTGWEDLGTTDGDHRLDLANEKQNGSAYQKVYDLEDGETYKLSLDIRHRGKDGDAAVEIYWDGDLIDTVVPLDRGNGWNTYTYNVVAGDGDYTKLKFVEVGKDNYKGTQIDNVRLTDSNSIAVEENQAGAEVVALSVVDPDAGDVHTFTVSDERFEVVSDGANYLLKLKDDQAVDFETEESITLDVTATDSGGLSDTETITIDVINTKDMPTHQIGTGLDDVLVGQGVNDSLHGEGGNDILIGQSGTDSLFGGAGNDVLRGGTDNDTMEGGDGSDIFAYMLGDGNDAVFGGAGANWIDIIDLQSAADGTPIGEYGSDWSITMTEGSIENVDALNGEITLSQDSGGYIDLADGGRVDFTDIEGIQY